MGFFSNLFGGGHQKNPADVANDYLNKIPGQVNPYYQPYIDQGREANKHLTEQYGKLTNNPNDLYSELGKGYQQSPGYQFKLNQALQSGTNAAAAGGMAGSQMHQQQAMQMGNDIANQDYEQYINHILGLYGTGLQGEQGLSQQGYNASTGYGDILGSNLGAQAGYGYAGQAGENANKTGRLNNFLNLGGTVLGGMLGGPLGAGIGKAVTPTSGSPYKPWNNPG